MQHSLKTLCLLSVALASASASLVPRDAAPTECQFFDAMSLGGNKDTCNDEPEILICPQGCKGAVVAHGCTVLNEKKVIDHPLTCDGAFTKSDYGDYYNCANGDGSFTCGGPFTGKATCSGCRKVTLDDNKPGDKDCVPRPCTVKTNLKSDPTLPDTRVKTSPKDQDAGKSKDKDAWMPPADKGDANKGDSKKSTPAQPMSNATVSTTHNATTNCTKSEGTPAAPPANATGNTPEPTSGTEALVSSGFFAPALASLVSAGFTLLL